MIDIPKVDFEDYTSLGDRSFRDKFVKELAGSAFFLWGAQVLGAAGVDNTWAWGLSFFFFKSMFNATMISALSFRNMINAGGNVKFFDFACEILAQIMGAYFGNMFFGWCHKDFVGMAATGWALPAKDGTASDITRTMVKELVACSLLMYFVNKSNKCELPNWLYIMGTFFLVVTLHGSAILSINRLFVNGFNGVDWVFPVVVQFLSAVFVASVQYFFD